LFLPGCRTLHLPLLNFIRFTFMTSALAKPPMTPEPLTLQASETKLSALGLGLLQVIEMKEINHIFFLFVRWGRWEKRRRKFNADISHLVLFLLMEISQKPK